MQSDYDAIQSQLQIKLDKLQFGGQDNSDRILVVDVPALDYGPLISHLMLGMQLGYILERNVVFRPSDDCSGLALFAPFSRISYTEIDDLSPVKASFDVEQFEPVVLFDYPEFWENHRLRRFFFPWAPLEFQKLRCGRLLFDGEFQRRVILTQESRQWLAAASVDYRHEEPVVGVYARRSTAEKEMDTASDEMLLDSAKAIAQKNGVQRVVVAGSDDLAESIRNSGLDAKRIVPPSAEPPPSLNLDNTTLRDMLELHVLSDCDWIVGRPSDDIARHAAARIGQRTFRCDRHSLIQYDDKNRGLSRFFRRRTNGKPDETE